MEHHVSNEAGGPSSSSLSYGASSSHSHVLSSTSSMRTSSQIQIPVTMLGGDVDGLILSILEDGTMALVNNSDVDIKIGKDDILFGFGKGKVAATLLLPSMDNAIMAEAKHLVLINGESVPCRAADQVTAHARALPPPSHLVQSDSTTSENKNWPNLRGWASFSEYLAATNREQEFSQSLRGHTHGDVDKQIGIIRSYCRWASSASRRLEVPKDFADWVPLDPFADWFLCQPGSIIPFDARQSNTAAGRPRGPRVSADAFFIWVYEELAEALPEADFVGDMPELVEDDADNLHDSSPTLIQKTDMPDHPVAANIEFPKEKKWLSSTTLTDLYAIYELKIQDGDDKACFSTFKRQWRTKWNQVLGIRRVGQHARCNECARLEKALGICQDKTKKDMLLAERQEHLRSVQADREMERFWSMLANLQKIDIDGMDQTKWTWPRNQLAAGHTHGAIDQNFLMLEKKKMVADAPLEKMQPIRNRKAMVEGIVEVVKQLGIHVKGLTPNPGENQIQSSSPVVTSTHKPQVGSPMNLLTWLQGLLIRRICTFLDTRSVCHFFDAVTFASMETSKFVPKGKEVIYE